VLIINKRIGFLDEGGENFGFIIVIYAILSLFNNI
jgi:hypothetical protein